MTVATNTPTQSTIFWIATFFMLTFYQPAFAQEEASVEETTSNKPMKTVPAIKAQGMIKVDGKLDDPAWQQAKVAKDFVTTSPTFGNTAFQPTEVKILYDDQAIYVGAYLYDSQPDSILREMGERDQTRSVNADYFAIGFDTYNDDQNAFIFYVTAANVQADIRFSNEGQDDSWNAVWFSKVNIVEDGWIVEMAIPYASLRFPEKEVQDWGMGMERRIRRIREFSTWQEHDPKGNGVVAQFGSINGFKDIEPPLRLSITPYTSFYTDIYRDQQEPSNNSSARFIRGGMDLKYGLNESFTLDMILIPDFGQVASDDLILNLSAFEVRFNERRNFFTEGTELYNKVDLFYSRRIGGRPDDFYAVEDWLEEGEEIVKNPSDVQMYNASKLSGRTKKGLGVGFLNSVTGKAFATIEHTETGEERRVQTAPLTNYNVFVLDKTLKNTSYIGLINTNVMREGAARDANVTGLDFRWSNKAQSYALSGSGALSQIFDHDNEDQLTLGHKHELQLSKTSGEFRWFLTHSSIDAQYDHNDLGFLRNNNEMTNSVAFQYNKFSPFSIFNSLWSYTNFQMTHRNKPFNFQEASIFGNVGVTYKNFVSHGIFFNARPFAGRDFYDPRSDDPSIFLKIYPFVNGGTWISSDYRKALAIDGNIGANYLPHWDAKSFFIRFGPRWRINDRFSVRYNVNYNFFNNQVGYAATGDKDEIYFGERDNTTITNVLSGKYSFTSRMNMNFRIRHYWSKVVYDDFMELGTEGILNESGYDGEHNTSYNFFNLNITYIWEFSPGSELRIVWKNDISHFEYEDTPFYNTIPEDGFLTNFNRTFDAPQLNSLSVKLLYYLDYQMLKRRG